MAIKIQTKDTDIPVEIGELKFTFDGSDESVVEFRKWASEKRKELAAIEDKARKEENEEKAMAEMKELLKVIFDKMLGKNAFDQIYELSPSITIMANYFQQLSIGIGEELESRAPDSTIQKKAKKYLQNKNKKNKNKKKK